MHGLDPPTCDFEFGSVDLRMELAVLLTFGAIDRVVATSRHDSPSRYSAQEIGICSAGGNEHENRAAW
jgi:hypothetical protein